MADKVIVITGANGGLGRALARRFAADGDRVALLARSLEKVEPLAADIGAQATAIACDVSSAASVKAAFAQIADTFGAIDALINSAAVFKPFLVEEASDDQIMGAILTNLAGPILCARSAIPLLRRGGHIINLSSESVDVSFPHLTLYQATKAGLETFGKHLHSELEDKGVRVTTVRAGQMMGPETMPDMDPIAGPRFFEAMMKRGINPMTRGTSQYASTTQIFRTLVDLPPDVHVGVVTFQGRIPD